MRKIPIEQRFWKYVKPPHHWGECWEWMGTHEHHGYGILTLKKDGKVTSASAHRMAYELMFGEVEKSLDLDHLCRNPGCVNPYHLEPVTHRENVMRGTSICAINNIKTHCIRGHPLSGDNLVQGDWRRGRRTCKICDSMNRKQPKIRERRNRRHRERYATDPKYREAYRLSAIRYKQKKKLLSES